MRANWLGKHSAFVVAILILALSGGPAPAAGKKDEALRKQALELNRLTGNNPIDGAFNALLKDKKGAKRLLQEARGMVKETPQPFNYYSSLMLAQVAEEFKDREAAEAFYRACIDHAAKVQSGRKLTQAYVGLIGLFYDSKKYEKSIAVCKEFLELKGDDSKDYVLAATDALGEDSFFEPKSFDPVRNSKPTIHRLMIQAVARQGKFEEAIKMTDTLIKAQPDDWLNLALKGMVYREAGRYTNAAKVYEEVIDQIKNDNDTEEKEKKPFLERYRYYLSNLYMELKKIDKAAEQLKELMTLNPEDPTYCNDLGYIWADHDINLAEAEKLIRKALAIDRQKRKKANTDLKPEEDRDNGAYLDSLGWVLFKQKKYEEAKKVLLKAVEDKTNQHIEIYDHLGDVYMALKEKDKAVAAWKKGLGHTTSAKRDKERKALVEKKIKGEK
jgi:tetratricopeptide (TPR) repeat protein